MMEKELKVGIEDVKSTRGEGSIVTYVLSSCIGIVLYDLFIHLGVLLHIMLPSQFNYNDINTSKYTNSGIHETIRKLTASGMVKPRTVIKIIGGTKMFEISGSTDFGDIGTRNIASVKKVLLGERMRTAAEDIGGDHAGTMRLSLSASSTTIKASGRPKKTL